MNKEIKLILKNKNLKATKSRIEILKFFYKRSKPVDINFIKKYLYKKKLKINESTIYRILSIFIKNNFLKKLEFKEGKFRYELAFLPHHHHLICNYCGRIDDIRSKTLHKTLNFIEDKISKSLGFKVQDHKIEFFGKCKNCCKKINE